MSSFVMNQFVTDSSPASWQPTGHVMRAALIGSYGASAALSAVVWARSLPTEVRSKPLSWPGRVADGVAKSLVSLAPASTHDPVNVKYALLSSSFLFFSALPILLPYPWAVCPSWAGRRVSRAFPVCIHTHPSPPPEPLPLNPSP